MSITRRHWLSAAGTLLAGCALQPARPPGPLTRTEGLWLDRLCWGAAESDAADLRRLGLAAWREQQLRPAPWPPRLPPAWQAAVDAMEQTRTEPVALARRMEAQRRAVEAQPEGDARAKALMAWGRDMNALAREGQRRLLARAIASPRQLQSQLGWFWLNHFSVFQNKSNARVTLPDLDEQLQRAALGRFRDLLGIATLHPAMLRYLDNEQNTAQRLNENLGRELLELHTLGVDGGYTQADVQTAARVLTGLGYAASDTPPRLPPELASQYQRRGLAEFHPQRHDGRPKTLLGQPLTARGLDEVEQMLDRLAAHPSTARHVSRRLALHLMGQPPSEALLGRLAQAFVRHDGRIDEWLRVLFAQPEFEASLGQAFKDPTQWLVSALRQGVQGEDPALPDLGQAVVWLERLGQQPYGRLTPDGYPLDAAAWRAPGQLTARFDLARTVAGAWPTLWRGGSGVPPLPGPGQALWAELREPALSAATRGVLAQARSPAERAALWLAAPESMQR
jgi:uncharacterized protein (DUF1800 family)